MPVEQLTKLFREFFSSERTGGLILLGCTLVSLVIANSDGGMAYQAFWHQKADLSFAGIGLNYSIEHWVNDGLMAVFFLLVGLEIERELYVGELREFSNAILPLAAALGGMLVPAAIHYALNAGSAGQPGFGIPMATDIAFALGMLSLLGNRVPPSLKVFLTALAILDDLGAILVIAVFYNHGISWINLGLAGGTFLLLMVFNKLKIYKLAFYLVPGLLMWYFMLKSGVHATLAGVLLAIAIPFAQDDKKNPSYKLQHFLHKPVAFLVLPVFALANTGLVLGPQWTTELRTSNSLGILFGLVLGKPVGILLFCAAALRLGKSKLPAAVNWSQLTGASLLAGIGFTMSIFISNLAFNDPASIQSSKIAVLLASLLACLGGLAVLRLSSKKADY